MVISKTVQKIVDFLKNLTGIVWIMVIDKSKESTIYTYRIISSDLVNNIGEIIITMSKNLKRLREILLSLHPSISDLYSTTMYLRDKMIVIEEYLDYIYVYYGDSKLYHSISNIFDMLRKHINIKCYSCGSDLILTTYKCPKCGKAIPFTTSKCPYCKSNIKVKKCPYCSTLINSISGKKIYRNIIALLISMITGLIIIASSIYIGLTLTPPTWDIIIIGSLIGILIMYISSRIFYKTF